MIEIQLKIYDKETNSEKYYIIEEFKNPANQKELENHFRLFNEEGEGGTFDIQELYELIDKYFKENF